MFPFSSISDLFVSVVFCFISVFFPVFSYPFRSYLCCCVFVPDTLAFELFHLRICDRSCFQYSSVSQSVIT